MKTFEKFRKDAQLNERFLTRAECLQAYHEGVRDGTIGQCPYCGSPNLQEAMPPDPGFKECVDCGQASDNWRITEETCPMCKVSGQVKPSGPFRECGNCKQVWNPALQPKKKKVVKEDEFEEDEGGAAPTNNAGSGNIAGIGVGPQGEPGVHPEYQRKRHQLELVGPPAVDPRMFANKIFNHGKNSPKPKK